MKDIEKVKKNLLIGLAGQIIAVLLGVVLPKQILDHFGSEVNGLISSITNVYACIAIVEAGITAASCQALYKPVAEKDYKTANAVIAASHHNYRRVGRVYVGLITLLSIVYPAFVKTELTYSTVALIVLFNGIGNAINFFFHSKYLVLLKADGKQYVRSILDTVVQVVKQITKIALICTGFDVVVVQSVAMLVSALQMIWITYYIKKHYDWIDLKVKPDFSAISQSKYVLAHEINYLITANLDIMLLTVFSDLKVVSIYSLYSMLYGMITRILLVIRNALEFKIAYAFHRSRENFLRLFETYEVCYITLASSLISIVNFFILPFLRQYTAEITDVNYINTALPPLFAMVFLFAAGRYPADAMIHISGHFQQTKNSATAETFINLVISIVLVQFCGICGVLIGTVVSSFFRMIYLIQYVNRKIIRRSTITTYLCWGINLVLLFTANFLNRLIPVSLDNYIKIFVFCVPYSIVTLLVFYGVNFLCMPRIAQRIQMFAANLIMSKKK